METTLGERAGGGVMRVGLVVLRVGLISSWIIPERSKNKNFDRKFVENISL